MKKIKIIDEKEIIYVQRQDISFLNRINDPIPASIFFKAYPSGVNITDGSNRFDYLKFEEPEEVEFFKKADYIIDADEYKNLTIEEVELKFEEVRSNILKKINDSETLQTHQMEKYNYQLKWILNLRDQSYIPRKKEKFNIFRKLRGN